VTHVSDVIERNYRYWLRFLASHWTHGVCNKERLRIPLSPPDSLLSCI